VYHFAFPHISVDRYYNQIQNHANIHSLQSQSQSSVPPPLQVPPSRARRQFALRLAQRKAQLESTREQEEDPENPGSPKTQEQEEREGHQRFARMFEGIDDSSDDENEGMDSHEGSKEADEKESDEVEEGGVEKEEEKKHQDEPSGKEAIVV
jgi:SIT4-associating protein SAP185/190